MNFENGIEVHCSCGATLNGRHWIIGGRNEKRQVCHLRKNHQNIKTVIQISRIDGCNEKGMKIPIRHHFIVPEVLNLGWCNEACS